MLRTVGFLACFLGGVLGTACAAPAAEDDVASGEAQLSSVDEICGMPAIAPKGGVAAINVCGGASPHVALADLRTNGVATTVSAVAASGLEAVGEVFTYLAGGAVHVHGWDGAKRATIPLAQGGSAPRKVRVVASFDAKWLVVAHGTTLYVAALDSGNVQTLTTGDRELTDLLPSPSSGAVLVVAGSRVQRLTLAPAAILTGAVELPRDAVVLRDTFDGRRVGAFAGRLLAVDLEAAVGAATKELAKSDVGLGYLASSHGFAYVTDEPTVNERTVRRIHRVPLDGSAAPSVIATMAGAWADPRGDVANFHVSSDGKTAFFTYGPTRHEAYGVDAYFLPTDGSLAPTLATTDLVRMLPGDWVRRGDKLRLATPGHRGNMGGGWEFDLRFGGSLVSIPVLPRVKLGFGTAVVFTALSDWQLATVKCEADGQYTVASQTSIANGGRYLECFAVTETHLLAVPGTDRVVVARAKVASAGNQPPRYRLDVIGPDPR